MGSGRGTAVNFSKFGWEEAVRGKVGFPSNTVISDRFALPAKMASKTVIRPIELHSSNYSTV